MKFWWAPVLAAIAVFNAAAQSTNPEDLAPGKLLVAQRDLKDPNFERTVVLLVKYDEDGVVGLILNRRSTVRISTIFEDLQEARGKSDPVYVGGPVERKSALALLRTRPKPDDAERVFADVSMIGGESLMRKTLADNLDAERFHIYLGYAGWAMQQLDNEVEAGAWFIFPADAGLVFDKDPDTLWTRLMRRVEQRVARR